MKKLIVFLILSALMGTGCRKDEAPSPCACGVEEPQQNMPWLNYLLQKRFYTEIYSIQYEGEEYIGVYDPQGNPDSGAVIYDCDGNMFCQYIGLTGAWTCSDSFKGALSTKKLIYTQETNPYWENEENN